MRNQMAMAPQILAQGQQRLQGVPAQFEPRFMERSVRINTNTTKTVKENEFLIVHGYFRFSLHEIYWHELHNIYIEKIKWQ